MSFSERLKEALSLSGIKQVDLSRKTGIDKSLISNYVSGKYKAKQDNIYLLAKALNVSEAWLMGFDVTPERDVSMASVFVSNEPVKLPEIEFISLFDRLSAKQQRHIVSSMKELLSCEESEEE